MLDNSTFLLSLSLFLDWSIPLCTGSITLTTYWSIHLNKRKLFIVICILKNDQMIFWVNFHFLPFNTIQLFIRFDVSRSNSLWPCFLNEVNSYSHVGDAFDGEIAFCHPHELTVWTRGHLSCRQHPVESKFKDQLVTWSSGFWRWTFVQLTSSDRVEMIHFNLIKCTYFIIATLAVARAGLFFNKYTTRFCYNSPNVTITVSVN